MGLRDDESNPSGSTDLLARILQTSATAAHQDLCDDRTESGVERYHAAMLAYKKCGRRTPGEILELYRETREAPPDTEDRRYVWDQQYRAELEWVVNCMVAGGLIDRADAPSWLPTVRAVLHVGQLIMGPVNVAIC